MNNKEVKKMKRYEVIYTKENAWLIGNQWTIKKNIIRRRKMKEIKWAEELDKWLIKQIKTAEKEKTPEKIGEAYAYKIMIIETRKIMWEKETKKIPEAIKEKAREIYANAIYEEDIAYAEKVDKIEKRIYNGTVKGAEKCVKKIERMNKYVKT